MTETEWAEAANPGPMIGFLHCRGAADERQCRLFACACVRRIWSLLPDAACGHAVVTAERFADGAADVDQLAAALAGIDFVRRLRGAAKAARTACWSAAFDRTAASRLNPAYGVGVPYGWESAARAADHAREAAVQRAASRAPKRGRKGRHAMPQARDAESRAQAALLRCLLGPLPFRTPRVDPGWRSPLVLSLAQAAYKERIAPDPARTGWLVLDGERLLVLADALEEAGCDEPEVLRHLREWGEHVRGCWAVDVILEKS
jgi:hypothetical protein